jgi:hypothetical protein
MSLEMRPTRFRLTVGVYLNSNKEKYLAKQRLLLAINVGLPYIHQNKRGHFPATDHKKENISAEKEVKKMAYK